MKKVKTWILGLILIVFGVVWGMNVLGIVKIDIFFPGWWTLFIIIPCFIDLFTPEKDKTGDLIGIAIGVALMLGCLGVLSLALVGKMLVPVVLVIIGVTIICKDLLKGKILKKVKKSNKDGEHWATFSGQKLNFAGKDFEGAKLDAIFGGIQCDLREAKIKNEALIKASSVFGGITILVPEDVEVKMISTALFGGTSNKHDDEAKTKKKTLYIDATCIFGGVEVK